jgi:hypothetical protein
MTAVPQPRPGAGGRSSAPVRHHRTARRGLILAIVVEAVALVVGSAATTPAGRGVGIGIALTGGLLAVRIAWAGGWDR